MVVIEPGNEQEKIVISLPKLPFYREITIKRVSEKPIKIEIDISEPREGYEPVKPFPL